MSGSMEASLLARASLHATVLLLLGCRSEITGPEAWRSERRPATIEHYGTLQLSVPGVVREGQEFLVSVVTYGNGCVSQADTEVGVEETGASRRVEVAPYDWHLVDVPGELACTDELNSFEHTVVARLNGLGRATVAVKGTRKPGGTSIVIEREVQVDTISVNVVHRLAVAGRVTDSAGRPLENARIEIRPGPCLSTGKGTLTDALGDYRVVLLHSGHCAGGSISVKALRPWGTSFAEAFKNVSLPAFRPITEQLLEARADFQLVRI
jgi:hypothetical protein